MLKRLLTYLSFGVSTAAFAQDSSADSGIVSTAFNNAVSSYHQYIDHQSRLFAGIEFFGYAPSIEGIPYYHDGEWNKGTIVYDNIRYDTVRMMYDLVKDRVVILHYNRFFRLSLFSEKVKEFTVLNHHFVRIEKDSSIHAALSTGFYDELYNGPTKVLMKRSKFIEETVKDVLERKFIPMDKLYLLIGGQYHIIRTRRALLSYLKDHAREVKQYLRKQKLSFKHDRENTVAKAAAYYDSLNN